MDELLSELEMQLVSDLGGLMSKFRAIVGDGRTEQNDMFEVMLHVHALQNMVMSQAAARAYPTSYRLLGDVVQP